jgi:hypothetical protein
MGTLLLSMMAGCHHDNDTAGAPVKNSFGVPGTANRHGAAGASGTDSTNAYNAPHTSN